MLTAARNYDVVCWQMFNYLHERENPLKKETNKLINEIKSFLLVSKELKSNISKFLPAIFNFRIKAIRWLIQEHEFDSNIIFDEVYPQFEELAEKPKLKILAENILFALRCNRRVLEEIINTAGGKETIKESIVDIPEITYSQFVSTIALSIPDDDFFKKIVDWTNSSLVIELVILAAHIISTESLKVSDKIINDLAFSIADSAQLYSAIAYEIGLLKFPSNNQNPSIKLGHSFIKEQQNLADLGLYDLDSL